ncbi:MAG TPA: ATP-binding protein, partial [Anaerolineales bacterium]|nr:ATP-binding protein [Anaerolineales bacterium]
YLLNHAFDFISTYFTTTTIPFFVNKMDALLNGQKLPVYERVFVKKDGTEFPVEVNAALVYDANQKPLYVQSVVRDISTRKQAEQAIASLAKFPEESPFPFFRISMNRRILYANKSSAPLLQSWQTRTGESFPAELFQQLFSMFPPEGASCTIETKVDAHTFAFTFVPIPDMGYINVYAQDITEAKRADRMKAEFIANVSHELRTPLASILGYTELLFEVSATDLTSTQKEFLDVIYDSGQHLLMLVNDLIDVTKMETGRLELQLKKTQIRHTIEKVYMRLLPIANNKNILLDTHLASNLPPILADEGRLEQVISNLLSNAIKFTPVQGTVKLKAQVVQNELQFCVCDTGMGIHEEDIPRLFNRFYRGQNVSSTTISGTGLGLYITKAIIEAHGGTITVRSIIGEGSVFEVHLPIQA